MRLVETDELSGFCCLLVVSDMLLYLQRRRRAMFLSRTRVHQLLADLCASASDVHGSERAHRRNGGRSTCEQTKSNVPRGTQSLTSRHLCNTDVLCSSVSTAPAQHFNSISRRNHGGARPGPRAVRNGTSARARGETVTSRLTRTRDQTNVLTFDVDETPVEHRRYI